MSLFLLTVAFLLTGVNLIISKTMIELGLIRCVHLYMMVFWGVGVIVGLVVRGITRHECTRKDFTLGVAMGTFGAVAMLTFMIAIDRFSGVVVFPVRSCGNILLTAFLSWIIWRERLSALQWLGILCAALSIYLLL